MFVTHEIGGPVQEGGAVANVVLGARVRPNTNHFVSYHQPSTNQRVYYGLGLRV